jgi:uncharacterized Ntn-hydrolase superfamily protein
MTWSIVARDPRNGEIGIAVTTCAFAVGSRVPSVETGVGAIASQAFVNPFYGPKGLAMLRSGANADTVVARLTAGDEGRSERQLHVMDSQFRFAAYTGASCIDWCGHLIRETFSVAGNMLAGEAVITETARAFEATGGSLADRFIAGLRAGQAAGGDRRGRQSAAMLIHDGEDYALYDLRVDDHPEPIEELARLLQVSRVRSVHFRKAMPSRANPHGVIGRDEIERRIAASIAEAEGKTG